MTKTFMYQGGPRDKEISQAEEADFPEIHPGGEYQWGGISHSQVGARDPDGPLPEADRAIAVWHSTSAERIQLENVGRRWDSDAPHAEMPKDVMNERLAEKNAAMDRLREMTKEENAK